MKAYYLTAIVCVLLACSASEFRLLLQEDNSCPPADEGFTRGCMSVAENEMTSNGPRLQIFYEYRGEIDHTKETIIFLNGGPGGALSGYIHEPIFESLRRQYNVVFYDQRGVGRSSQLSAANVVDADLTQYSTEANIRDLLALQNVLGVDRAIIMGHSYGAHLALAYAIEYPERVSHVIDVAGSLDAEGFIVQSHLRNEILTKISSEVGDQALGALLQVIQSGQALDEDGQPFTLAMLQGLLTMNITFYDGQTRLVGEKLRGLVAANQSAVDAILGQELNAGTNLLRTSYSLEEGINPIVNQTIACNELIPRTLVEAWHDEDVRNAAAANRLALCGGAFEYQDAVAFDYKDRAKELTVPTLIFGGKFDPLIPYYLQERDSKLIPKATFVGIDHAGHQLFQEAELCIESHLLRFLKAGNFDDVGCDAEAN